MMQGDTYQQAWWGSWWPWAEANQGLLSVFALAIALVLFLIEQRRANEAAASAERFAVEERATAALKVETDKAAALALERRDRAAARALAAETIRASAEAVLRQQIDTIDAYQLACIPMLTQMAALVKTAQPESFGGMYRLNRFMVNRVRETRAALAEIIRIAPADIELIVTTQNAIAAFDNLLQYADASWEVGQVTACQTRGYEMLMTAVSRMAAGGTAAANKIRSRLTPPSGRGRKSRVG